MFLLLFLCMILFTCDCYKILVVSPKIGYSHMNFMGKIADTLVDAGHDVVTLQPVIFPFPSNGTKKSRLIQVSARLPPEQLEVNAENLHVTWTFSATNPLNVNKFNNIFYHFVKTSISKTLEKKELMEQLKGEDFDVGITELFDFTGIAVFEAIGLKNIIGTHSSSILEGTAYSIGMPIFPSFMPASQGATDDSPSFSNRALNLLFTHFSWRFQDFTASVADTVMKELLGKSAKSVWDIVSDISFILTNTEPFLDFAKPTLHNIVDIGGIGVHESKPLDEKWNRILSLRSQTVLISFGSVARCILMPAEMKNAIVEVVKSYPHVTFIWKYEEPEEATFANGVENLVLSEWTPQNDLLADSRLTLFITHGGAGSLMESASCGKPLIVVPLFGDQVRNAKLVEKFGFGLILDKAGLVSSSAVNKSIHEVLSNEKYHKAARRIQKILEKRPFSPEEKLIKTVELAAEFGEMPELRIAGRKLGFFAYYNLDIWFLFTVTCVFTLSMSLLLVQRIFSKLGSIMKYKVE